MIPRISDRTPNKAFPRKSINIPRNINLADPQFYLPQKIDMLIGSGTTMSLLSIGQINLSRDGLDLFLQKTQLRWTIAGGTARTINGNQVFCQLTELRKQIERFWLLDDANAFQIKTIENNGCEMHFVKNVTRDISGCYTVRLPFRIQNPDFGDSRSIALRRFVGMRKKLDSDPELKCNYYRVMNEYINSGHMSQVTDESLNGYYLPHHAVIKATSATTKTRVVFDASAKSSKGVSSNDTLMVGPTIQLKLFKHLVRFCTFKYVLTADIAKMYRQVWIHPDERRYQRIFWLHADKIQVFQLNTVTFGISSAPFLAIRRIQKLASDESSDFPIGAKTLHNNFYVDDLLSGANTLEELIHISDEVIEILKSGGFDIRQWASNHPRALENPPERLNDLEFLTDENPIQKTLGISWNAQRDESFYTVKTIERPDKITKRFILSEIAKIFDPLVYLVRSCLFLKSFCNNAGRQKQTGTNPFLTHYKWLGNLSRNSSH